MVNSSPVSAFCLEPAGTSAMILEEGRRGRVSHNALPPLPSSPQREKSCFGRTDTEEGRRDVDSNSISTRLSNGKSKPFLPESVALTPVTANATNLTHLQEWGQAEHEGGNLGGTSAQGNFVNPPQVTGSPGEECNPGSEAWSHLQGVPHVVGRGLNEIDPENADIGKVNVVNVDHLGVEKAEDEDPQRLFIGWLQRRQRGCVSVISLGCVTILLVEQLRKQNGTLWLTIALIPVAVQLLLVWDYCCQSWYSHCREQKADKVPGDRYLQEKGDAPSGSNANHVVAIGLGLGLGVPSNLGGTNSNADGHYETRARHQLLLGCREQGGVRVDVSQLYQEVDAGGGGGGGGCVSMGSQKRGQSTQSIGSTDSNSSNTADQESFAADGEDDSDSAGGGRGTQYNLRDDPQEDSALNLLETPFQKCIRLLQSASSSVTDPIVKKQLQRVEKLLADPDSLHTLKERYIRRFTTDMGTRSYIENILQTPVKGASADRWRKVYTEMSVVRALAKEAAAAAAAEAHHNGGVNGVQTDGDTGSRHHVGNGLLNGCGASTRNGGAESGNNSSKDDLDELLDEFVRGGGSHAPGSRRTSEAVDLKCWDADETEMVSFDQSNPDLVHEQQQVAKILSMDNFGKDIDRMTVKDLCDLLNKSPRNALEGQPVRFDGATGLKSRRVPRLPQLNEARVSAVANLLKDDGFLSWDFDVFDLEEKSGGHALWCSAMAVFAHYNLIGAFGLNLERLSQLLLCVEATYCFDPDEPNSYHTHVHAADVTLTVAHFMSVDAISQAVRSTHGLALLMAAILHDYRHPGVNNGFLVRELNPLAVTYNDSSVLENFHAAEGFNLMLDPKFNVFKGWKPESVKCFRNAFVKCILATDLALSMEFTSKFQRFTASALQEKSAGGSSGGLVTASGPDGGGTSTPSIKTAVKDTLQNQILLLQMVLKVADVAHPCKPWKIHRRWSDMVTEEFFRQGDKEHALGLSLSPLCDRKQKNLPKSQCDFIDFIVRPCVTIFSTYCQETKWSDHMNSNFRRWKSMQEEQVVEESSSFPVRRRSTRHRSDGLNGA